MWKWQYWTVLISMFTLFLPANALFPISEHSSPINLENFKNSSAARIHSNKFYGIQLTFLLSFSIFWMRCCTSGSNFWRKVWKFVFCVQVPLAFSDIIRNLTLLVSQREDFISFILVFLGMVHFKFKYMFLYKIQAKSSHSLSHSLTCTHTNILAHIFF